MSVTIGSSNEPRNPERRKFLAWLPLRLLDIVALILSISVSATITRWVLRSQNGSRTVRVTSGKSSWLLNLERDEVLEISGPLGISRVVVQQGKVYMKSSPCTNKICIKTGRISHPGQWIACLPNQIFVAIEGIQNKDVDAHSY